MTGLRTAEDRQIHTLSSSEDQGAVMLMDMRRVSASRHSLDSNSPRTTLLTTLLSPAILQDLLISKQSRRRRHSHRLRPMRSQYLKSKCQSRRQYERNLLPLCLHRVSPSQSQWSNSASQRLQRIPQAQVVVLDSIISTSLLSSERVTSERSCLLRPRLRSSCTPSKF